MAKMVFLILIGNNKLKRKINLLGIGDWIHLCSQRKNIKIKYIMKTNLLKKAVCKTRYLAVLLLLMFAHVHVWGSSVTISKSDTWAHTGTSGSGSTTDITKSNITFTTGKGYKDGTNHIRVYSSGEITISSTVGNITKIAFTSTASGTSNYGPSKISLKSGQDGSYSYSGSVGTWTYGSGTTGRSSVIFSASAQFRFTQVVVYYATATTSETSITGLDYTEGSGPSAAQSFTVSATDVTGNLTVTAPTNFEVCKTSGGTYTSSVTLTPSSGTVSNTTIYVRLASGKSAGTYGGATTYVTVTGGGIITKNVSVSGTVSAGSCTAPNHVDISGNWDKFGGETISLTAAAYSSAGTGSPIADANITGWQWQKLVSSTWTNVTNGTSGGATTSGATTKNLQITNCSASHSGKYRCVVSTGATCSTASATKTDGTEGYGVKVYVLECYNSGTTVYNFTRTGNSKAGTVEVTLSASTNYTFRVHADADYYGTNGTVNEDVTNWVMSTSEGNMTIASGLGGTFTFSMDYSTGGNNSTEGIPELSVTYPRKTLYLTPNSDWLSNSAKFAFYYFRDGGSTAWTDFLSTNDCGMSAEIPQWNGVKVIAARINGDLGAPAFGADKCWNQTDDLPVTSYNSIVITGWSNSQTYNTNYATPTYTISYAKGSVPTGGGSISGSRDSESKTCGTDFTLPSSAVFTTSGYTQDGWSTTNGGSKDYNLSGSYTTNAAQAFYPHWNITNYTITYNLNSGTQQVSPAPATSYTVASSTITLPTPTREGYDFAGWYANSNLSTGGVQTTIAAGSTGNKEYWAKWTKKNYTVTWKVNNGNYTTGVDDDNNNADYNEKIGKMPTAPADNSLNNCANKFMGWSKTNITKGSPVNGAANITALGLFTDVEGSPAITENTTFYAVFAESTNGSKSLTQSEISSFYCTGPACGGATNSYGSYTINSDDGNWTGVCASSYSNPDYFVNVKAATVSISDVATRPYLQSPTCDYTINNIAIRATHGANSSRTLYVSSSATNDPANNNVGSISVSKNNSSIQNIVPSSSITSFIIYTSDVITIYSITVSYGSTSNYVTQCADNQVRVTYNANGGSAPSCSSGVTTKNASYTVCSTEPTKTGYDFNKWNDGTSNYSAGASYNLQASVTFTAQWTPKEYTITYKDKDDAAYSGDNSGSLVGTHTYGTGTDLVAGTKGHDRFEGWYTTSACTGDPITSIGATDITDNITLYAKWTARHEIVFDIYGSGTTTIYRAEDEALNASVAGQGSIPANPSAPSACSSKVFIGWSEDEIDDETDDEPTFVDVSSAVNADKHYYSVWATSVGNSIAAAEDETFDGGAYETYYSKTYGLKANDKYVYKNSIWTSSDMTSGTKVRIKVKHLSNSSAATLTIALINSSGTVVTSTTLTTTANSSDIINAAYSSYVELTPTTAVTGYKITLSDKGSSSGVVILAATREVVATRSAYATSCCSSTVTLTHNSPEHGTIAFGKSKVPTCDADQNVSLTITPDAGYQLTGWTVKTTTGYADAKTTSPAVVTNDNTSSVQNITLTFAEGANKDYDVTATFGLMTVSSWTWTMNSSSIPNPLNLYVGQTARLDVAYTPSGVDASKKTYTRTKVDAYINWVGALQSSYTTISGKASTDDNTTDVTFTHADGPTTTVKVKVLPLPLVHFVDLVHDIAFADVVATLEDNALNKDKYAPTYADQSGSGTKCEDVHLFLMGWIDGDWSGWSYLDTENGTPPDISTITGAGSGVWIPAGGAIDVDAMNGKTYYAVWGKEGE